MGEVSKQFSGGGAKTYINQYTLSGTNLILPGGVTWGDISVFSAHGKRGSTSDNYTLIKLSNGMAWMAWTRNASSMGGDFTFLVDDAAATVPLNINTTATTNFTIAESALAT